MGSFAFLLQDFDQVSSVLDSPVDLPPDTKFVRQGEEVAEWIRVGFLDLVMIR